MSSKNSVQFKLMLPMELKTHLNAAASASRRSLSQEMVARLEASFAIDADDISRAANDPAIEARARVIAEEAIRYVLSRRKLK